MSHKYELTEKDKQTRAGWLILLGLSLILRLIYDTISIKNQINEAFPTEIYAVCYSIYTIMWYYLLYRFTYQKFGTKFITFYLVLNCMVFLILPISLYWLQYSGVNISSLYPYPALLSGNLFIHLLFLIWSFKMRKINKKRLSVNGA
ncbi:hypothetical protein N9Y92_00105 [Chlamydiales bacterium]|nr:hypothetical protein [Chlamydiales bacterium]